MSAGLPAAGAVIHATSGTRRISVTVVAVAEGAVRLRCNNDWTYQGGTEFGVSAERWPHTLWAQSTGAAA